MKAIYFFSLVAFLFIASCSAPESNQTEVKSNDYLDYSGKSDKLSGGARMIPIETPSGTFNVWTKRVGNNPKMKLLLLHGGPGASHEYFECFDSFLPEAGIEYYYYDQLESAYSDQPSDTSLWNIDRFVEEVEQVRLALGLDKDNFFLLGHSWGGILGMEYALKYQDNMKGLIISNMMASIPDYVDYANNVLGPQLDSAVLAEIRELEANEDYSNPRYTELIYEHYYPEHVLRMPMDQWPDPVNRGFANINMDMYVTMQGPSEFGIVGDAKLKNWDRTADLSKIKVPTLSIGGAYDTMDPEHMKMIAESVQNGEYLHCPTGSHFSMYDDQETYFKGLIEFIKSVQ
ncbi:proline iminopeptidase-family hydrolase [Marinoscillum pacificum]|uniref:proline iminopeptidase-family hydrolase n=1 Tax=Marinoscillum pacificum TaxID=392723 RepID=UPI0021571599|nr:proline iminopeptidase-family hydrolase [Marinoscillum pacificum]